MAIKKDVNMALLFLVIVPVILFISFSTYYDNKLKNLAIESDKRHVLASGNAVLEINNSKEQFLEEKYAYLSLESDDLRQDRLEMEQELALTKSELAN